MVGNCKGVGKDPGAQMGTEQRGDHPTLGNLQCRGASKVSLQKEVSSHTLNAKTMLLSSDST